VAPKLSDPADADLGAVSDRALLADPVLVDPVLVDEVLVDEVLTDAGPGDAEVPGEGGAMGDVVVSSVTTVSFHAAASSRPALH
jgi:hypothetical protein